MMKLCPSSGTVPVPVTAPKQSQALQVATLPNPAMTESQIIEKAQAGDVACFELLYSRHKRRIFSLCLRMVRDYTQAEDLTQEAFLQLYRKIALFRGESAFSTWFHRLAVNTVLMHLRKKTLPEVSLEETLEPRFDESAPKEFGGPDLALTGSIDRMTLERVIGDLPPGYRMIFILHDIEGYEHNEIATMLGCSIGNSKSQLHKARMKLRALLAVAGKNGVQPLPVAPKENIEESYANAA